MKQPIRRLYSSRNLLDAEMEWHEDYDIRGEKVYFRGREIAGADAASFRLINYGVARDSRHMFFMGVLAEGVDPESYELVDAFPDPSMPGAVSGYFRTRDGVFHDPIERPPRKLRATGDPASFRCLADHYATDGVNIFYESKRIAGAQLADWHRVGHCFYASNGSIYNWGRKLKGVPASSFEPLPGWGEYARSGFDYFHCWGPTDVINYVGALEPSHVVVGTVVDSVAVRGVKHMVKRPEVEVVDNGEGGWMRLLLGVCIERVLHNSTEEEPVAVGKTLPVLVNFISGSSGSPYRGPVGRYQGSRRTLFLRLSHDQPRDPSVLGELLYENYACLETFNYIDRLDQLINILALVE